MNPRYPLYIVSKGRAHTSLTARFLRKIGVPHWVIVEDQEFNDYARTLGEDRLLALPPKYQRVYETLDDLGDSKSKGPGPARNFAWDHSIAEGHDWHWVMDDNIEWFARFQDNIHHPVADGTLFASCEHFVDRYSNVGMAGPQYEMFIARKQPHYQPFVLNSRIYSCNLIRNDIPFRWRGRYNEDTILSIDLLTHGWCTVQFMHFLQKKVQTQKIKGGNTREFYEHEGTNPKSQLLKDVYPQYVQLVTRYGRPHHYIDYKKHWARRPRLRRRPGVTIPDGPNDYGLRLRPRRA